MTARFTESVGDVFQDLGFSVSEAEELRLLSELMIRVQELVRSLPGSQAAIASRLGVSQPRVSDLLRGKLNLFSLDSLTQMLTRLGAHVTISVDDFAMDAVESSVPAWRPNENVKYNAILSHDAVKDRQVTADSQLALAA